MPHEAMAEGYEAKIERVESGYQNLSKEPDVFYFFRTRHRRIDNVDAFYYAKFQDGFEFSMSGGQFVEEPYRTKHPEESGMVKFTYYFNPTPNDRNLEFEPVLNLPKGLDSIERVNQS